MKKYATIGLLLFLLMAAVLPAQKTEITVPLRFDRYYTLNQVYEAMTALNKAYPELTKLETVGKSDEGRPIMAMTLNNPKTGPSLDKPGIYVDGNMHGNEIQGGEICLYLLDYLLGNYGKNPEIGQLLDKTCFYVVPVVNADGRHHFFADANTSSSNRSIRIPTDDDRDGLVDEDFPDDLDGDGNICVMRRRDPFGAYKTDPEDPRLLVRVKPGEKGEWTIIGEEGLDNDGDGRLNEDNEGYVDGNRNWGYDWAPPYVQQGSGEYPFSGTGIKALAEWTYAKTNICVGWSFHNNGGMFLRGPSRKGLGEYPPQDVAVYDYLGKQSERIIPGYKYLISWKDLYTTYGDSVEWLTQTLGAYTYCAEVYMTESEIFRDVTGRIETGGEKAAAAQEISERERIKFSDNVVQGELYKPWKPFKHPVYGDIEIGGWVKISERLGAPFQIKDLAHRNAMAVIFTAKHMPEVSLEVTEVKAMAKNLYRIRTRLANPKAMPTMSYSAQKANLYPKDMLKVSGAKVVAGGVLNDPFMNLVTYKKYKPEIQFLFVPGFGKIEHEFLVEGRGSITISYESRHAGKLTKTVKLD
ncbi:MAG: M14 family metallopeptidase [Candidatus Aminicenantes bacterium]|nr:M14 family metallopeptidase [Candidatus Aminicenantes bacterium]